MLTLTISGSCSFLSAISEREGKSIESSGNTSGRERVRTLNGQLFGRSSLTIGRYLGRNNEALQDLKAQRRPGRPSSTQEDVLKHHRDVEEKELASGFWMPDLQHAENYPRLAEWNGEWTALAPLYFCRFLSSGESKPSKFPPDSLS